MLGGLLIFQAALAISVAAECDGCDTNVMLQSSASRKKDVGVDAASTWTSSRDVAFLREPDKVTFPDGQFLHIFSAVPSFGIDGSFIALVMSRNSSISLARNKTMFCSGPGRSHPATVRVRRSNLICLWPEEEQNQDNFEVFLEDEQNKSLGKVVASRSAEIAQGEFQTAMCVRDVFARGDRKQNDSGKGLGQGLANLQYMRDLLFLLVMKLTAH
eukprot:Skav210377  [mRNA]  locus=scaffold1526:93659:94511:+ [translate_table: standard]